MTNRNPRRGGLRQPSRNPLIALAVLAMLASGCGGGGGGGGGGLPGTVQLSGVTFDVIEGTVANIRVTRSGGSSGSASVDYATSSGSAEGGSDFNAASGTLTWANGLSGNQTISIAITDDSSAESLESFTVTLSNASGATLGTNRSATLNIVDNDSATLAAYGPITDLSSATVNGVRYDTDATSVLMNGLSAAVADLQLGQIVAVLGDANFSDGTGSADAIFYSATVIGPVENTDATVNRLVVLGQSVLTNSDTVFGPGIDPDTFAGLTVGATAQISGFRNAGGDIVASRVDLDATSTRVQLIGIVSGLDLANLLFSIERLTVDYGSASLIDLPGGVPEDGLQVIVLGSLANGILVVDEISNIVNLSGAPGDRVHLSGILTRFVSSTDFDLNGFPVSTDSSTRFVNGVVGDLQADAEITIDAEVISGSDIVLANTVNFGTLVSPRMTESFDFENFTNISIDGLARITINQGTIFSVEVTAASDIIDDVQVTQTGDTVSLGPSIGSATGRIFSGAITMPVLDQIDIVADSLANVTLNDFIQAQMTVNVDGVSRLYSDSLTISDVTATVHGVSLLDFGGIRPIGVANVDISGVSQATLNMDVGSSLSGSVSTGQGTGVSRLYYYGTNVTLSVTTDSQSVVTQLGDTRP